MIGNAESVNWPYRQIIDDHRKAARPLQPYLGSARRTALLTELQEHQRHDRARLGELVGLCAGPCEFPAIDDQIFGPYRAPVEEVLQYLQRAGSVARLRGERGA